MLAVICRFAAFRIELEIHHTECSERRGQRDVYLIFVLVTEVASLSEATRIVLAAILADMMNRPPNTEVYADLRTEMIACGTQPDGCRKLN